MIESTYRAGEGNPKLLGLGFGEKSSRCTPLPFPPPYIPGSAVVMVVDTALKADGLEPDMRVRANKRVTKNWASFASDEKRRYPASPVFSACAT
jgi:hypothetical protein